MEEKTVPTDAVKNVFKNGRKPTKEEYTKIWIDMINHIERLKANQRPMIYYNMRRLLPVLDAILILIVRQ